MSESATSKLLLLISRLFSIGIRNPSGLRPVLGHALAETENHLDRCRDLARVQAVSLDQLIQESNAIIELRACIFPHIAHSISTAEAVALAALLQKAKAKLVFEFGTNRGVSTTQLALNVSDVGQVFTLDLPKQNRQTKFDIRLAGDVEVAQQVEKADLIPDHLRNRITFLECDSATFDEKPYAGKMDAVFVDGAHIYDYVRNDSEKGWRMLRPGGVIIWHDFRPQTPDVMRYIFENNLKSVRIEGTTLAFAVKPVENEST